jgi:hypothetical protein
LNPETYLGQDMRDVERNSKAGPSLNATFRPETGNRTPALRP